MEQNENTENGYSSFLKSHYMRCFRRISPAKIVSGTLNEYDGCRKISDTLAKHSHIADKPGCLGNFELDIDAPIEFFEMWFDHNSRLYPELGIAIMPSMHMKAFYLTLSDYNIDEQTKGILADAMLSDAIKKLIDDEVISYAD